MEAIIVRLEIDPEAAALLAAIVEEYHSSRIARLGTNPPIHTRARLEEQREKIEGIERALKLAIANPDLVEVPDPLES